MIDGILESQVTKERRSGTDILKNLVGLLQGDPRQVSQVFLEDFSKYGTFINGIRITGTVNVKSGDELLFGKNNSLYR